MMKKINIAFVVFVLWTLFPVIALWLMLTHPGKCALIWKKELENSWWSKDEK